MNPTGGVGRYDDIAPVFVVGVSRSGTTLLRVMLNAHPDIQLLGELHFFDLIAGLEKRIPPLSSPAAVRELCRLVRRTHNFRYLQEGPELLDAVADRLPDPDDDSLERFHREMMLEYARRHGARRCGEKTPEYVRHLRTLLQVYPRARVLHIVRDPRDVVASLRRMEWASPDALTNALRWKGQIVLASRSRRESPHALHELRYEDLVSDPVAELKSICRFLGEEWSPAMMGFRERADREVDLNAEPWKARTARPLDASSIGRWRKELSPAERSLVEMVCGREMRAYGYEAADSSLAGNVAVPLIAGREALRWFRYKLREHGSRRHGEENVIHPPATNAALMLADAFPVWIRSLFDRS